MTVAEAAALLDVTRQTIHYHVRVGRIRVVHREPQGRRADGTWAPGGMELAAADVFRLREEDDDGAM